MQVTAKHLDETLEELLTKKTLPGNYKELITPQDVDGDTKVAIMQSLSGPDEYRVSIEKLTPTTMEVSCKCTAGVSGHLCKHIAAWFGYLRDGNKAVHDDAKPAPEHHVKHGFNLPAVTQENPVVKAAMEALQKPFLAEDVEWRVSRSGVKNDKVWATVLAYITARAVHQRLDEVFGLGGWKNEFRPFSVGESYESDLPETPEKKRGKSASSITGIICRLWFRDPDTGDWAWKENGAAATDIESFKGGLSSSEKRAFAELGGGRYLYRLTENFAITSTQKSDATPNYGKTSKEKKVFYWGPPQLPAWALP